MKRFHILCLLCICCSFLLEAQSVRVVGKLISGEDEAPLPYATISVSKETTPSVSLKKMATDDKGMFQVDLSEGNYLFDFHYIGMTPLQKKVAVGKTSPLDLGVISLYESSTELAEVSVTAQKPLVKVEIDKLSYNASDDPDASTSSVLEILRKVPLVTVDGEENIKVKGSSSFKIYINGKPSNMVSNNPSQVLRSMPAKSIKNIEVITDPGAKYDAEGVSGILNIITDKKVDNGYAGSIGTNADSQGGYGFNGYLSLKYGKFGLTGNGGYYHANMKDVLSTSHYEEFLSDSYSDSEQYSNTKAKGSYLSAEMSYELDTLNLFNASINRYIGDGIVKLQNTEESFGSRQYTMKGSNESFNDYGSMNVGADYQRSFAKKGKLLTFSYRYNYDPNNSSFLSLYNQVTGNYLYPEGSQISSINNTKGNEHTAQIDYVNPLTTKHTIETGVKYIYRHNESNGQYRMYDPTLKVWNNDLSRQNDMEHQQQIVSGYASYVLKLGKWGWRSGLRGEYTNQTIHFINKNASEPVHSSFLDIVPSTTLSYQLGMTQTLRGGYNMRISRPGISYLNPYRDESNPRRVSFGNPDLDAARRHNFNINYGSFAQKINVNVGLNVGFSNNAIKSYSYLQDNIIHNTYGNIGRERSIGMNGYFSWTPTQWFNMFSNMNLSHFWISNANKLEDKNQGLEGSAFAGGNFTLPKDIRISFNGGVFAQSGGIYMTMSPFYFYMMSLQKSFFNKKLDVLAFANQPFQKTQKMVVTYQNSVFTNKNISYTPAQSFGIRLTYTFGELKSSMKKVQRTITNDDVVGGSKNQQQQKSGAR